MSCWNSGLLRWWSALASISESWLETFLMSCATKAKRWPNARSWTGLRQPRRRLLFGDEHADLAPDHSQQFLDLPVQTESRAARGQQDQAGEPPAMPEADGQP